jgi:Tol biopolymer transport system component
MYRFGIALLFLAAVIGTTAANAGVGTSWSVVFCSNRDGDDEIYTMNADGSNLQQLTFNTYDETGPACSPDGNKIVFVSNGDGNEEIYAINIDGTGLTRLTNHSAMDLNPDWSPCGTKIIFASERDGDREIYVMNTDGSGLQQLTNNSFYDASPDWSPDGTKIVFYSDRATSTDIWVTDADGANPQNLTGGTGANYMPDWSPDGSKIVFESTRQGSLELYTMNADGSNVQRITYTYSDNHEPDWSPDGSLIMFASHVFGNYEILTVPAGGGSIQNLSNHGATDWGPSWRLTVDPYFGRTPPGTTPVRFPPDSLLATDSLFWHGPPNFSPHLQEMYWANYAKHPGGDQVELFFVEVSQGEWTSATHPAFGNTSYGENNPFFSTTGDTLYFLSRRPGGFIFRTIRVPTGWSDPVPLAIPLPADGAPGWQFSVARIVNIYFELWRDYGALPPDIYRTRLVGGVYQPPEDLGSAVNSTADDFTPFIDLDEQYLIFTSNRPGGLGFHDLYVSFWKDGAWTPAVNMGEPINSDFEDFAPYISPDGLYMFFSTQRAGDLGYNPYWLSSSVIDSIRVIVPTRLSSFHAGCNGSNIEIVWRLSDIEADSRFHVLRSKTAGQGFRELDDTALQEYGLSFRYVDENCAPGETYYYRVDVSEREQRHTLFETGPVAAPAGELALHQNHPNPFNPNTTISVTLPARSRINLSVYDPQGHLVKTLADGVVGAGLREHEWDGKDTFGTPVSSGIYFYRLTAGKKSITKKMLLLK